MLDKLEIELKKIAKKILSSSNSNNLDEISKDILDLYEKIILYKYSKKNQSSVLTPEEFKKEEEFKSSKKPPEEIIKLKPIEEKTHNNNIIQEGNDYKRDKETKKNLNDQFARELQIDLNDKNAFIKHLFNENETIYERSIQEIKNFKNFVQVKKVIDRIKKFHNNWEGKESYEKRFIYLLQKNFR